MNACSKLYAWNHFQADLFILKYVAIRQDILHYLFHNPIHTYTYTPIIYSRRALTTPKYRIFDAIKKNYWNSLDKKELICFK